MRSLPIQKSHDTSYEGISQSRIGRSRRQGVGAGMIDQLCPTHCPSSEYQDKLSVSGFDPAADSLCDWAQRQSQMGSEHWIPTGSELTACEPKKQIRSGWNLTFFHTGSQFHAAKKRLLFFPFESKEAKRQTMRPLTIKMYASITSKHDWLHQR